jgi:N-acetylneuraminate synthase/sialic acid synthase
MLGSRVVEKHFTLNRAMKGADHKFSLEPDGMRKMVRDLKRVYTALGDGIKKVYESEKAPLEKMSKSIVAKRDLPAGHVLTEDDLAIKIPGGGIPPFELENLVNRILVKPIVQDHMLKWNELEKMEDACLTTN